MNEPYPISLILKDRRVAVIGGGEVAERKIMSLLDTGAKITVIAPEVTNTIKSLAEEKRLCLKQRDFAESDGEGSFLVFVATNSNKLNRKVSRMARGKGFWVNCVDVPEECDFYVPSFFRRGSLTLAVSTAGKIPALAKKVNRELQRAFGEVFAEYVDLLAKVRENIIKERSFDSQKKKELLEALMGSRLLDLLKEGKRQEALTVIRDFLKENFIKELKV
ncbi:MAG: bifunctional precorrin-2 dehydrogenase/sirohydrochlorin ferrochelatase [Pseudomonadota bacterium]